MTHEQAYTLCHGNENFGQLWNTSERTECDLAWAIADQYEAAEELQARAAIALVNAGFIPPEWDPAPGNSLQPLPEGMLICVSCLELVNPEPDRNGCGCHCPDCHSAM